MVLIIYIIGSFTSYSYAFAFMNSFAGAGSCSYTTGLSSATHAIDINTTDMANKIFFIVLFLIVLIKFNANIIQRI